MDNIKSFLFKYFTPAILISILLIMGSSYFEEIINVGNHKWIKIIIDFVKAISVAVLVAGLFSWITSTERFIKRIQSILESILIDMRFLADFKEDKKKEIIKSLFRSNKKLEFVPNIDEYYNFYIDHILRVAHETVRTNYFVDTKIWFDAEINKVVCRKHHHYRIYRNEQGVYDDITIGVIPSDIYFELSNVIISNNSKILEEIEKPEAIEVDWEGEKAKIATISLDKYKDEKFLNIEYINCEYGFNHWYTAAIQILKPTYGLVYKISCEGDLIVKAIDTFTQGALFSIQREQKEVTITSNQWLNPGAGVNVIVGIEEKEVTTE